MNNKKQPAKARPSLFKQLITMLLLIVVFIVVERQINTWLGKRTIAENNLKSYSYEQALELSQQYGKPMLLNFSAIWCGACRRFESRVLADAEVKNTLENDYYYVRLEYESNDKTVFNRYGVRSFPTVLMQQAHDQARQLPTSVSAEEFLARL